jgi:hypothetical protein
MFDASRRAEWGRIHEVWLLILATSGMAWLTSHRRGNKARSRTIYEQDVSNDNVRPSPAQHARCRRGPAIQPNLESWIGRKSLCAQPSETSESQQAVLRCGWIMVFGERKACWVMIGREKSSLEAF